MTRPGRRGRGLPARVSVVLLSAGVLLAGCASGPTPPAVSVPASPAPGGATSPAPTSTAPTTTDHTPAPATATRTPASDWRTGPTVAGVDVSRYNPRVDWAGLAASGHGFAYVKATEGTGHVSPTGTAQAASARQAGLLVGGYHYARPAASDGATQARFFTANGGRWSGDGRTLPGALDLEQSTSGERCHGLTVVAMRRWVRAFADEYAELNGRPPVLYVKAEVWRECVGDSGEFGDLPLWLFDLDGGPDPLPAGWERPTLWQRGVESTLDRNVFFGDPSQLLRWASGLR